MKTLLVISHGSRRAASNEEVFRLTEELRSRAAEDFSLVRCAFLEITEPNVQTCIDELVKSNATEILVFPHFLAAGAHVTHDIPHEIKRAAKRHPGLTLKQLPHLGALPGLSASILQMINPNTTESL